MRFERLDLNLLVALDALLTERSVSLAADRLYLSQSATSSALSRLRDYFGDELLVTRGRAMVLTVRAEGLIQPVRAVLDQIRATVITKPRFEQNTSDRQIRIMASDYTTQVLLAEALRLLGREAPYMRFEIQPMTEGAIEALERRDIDLLLTIDYAISPDHPSAVLFEDDYVVVGWDGNPAMAVPMTRETYFALGHVTARFGKARVAAFDDWFMRRQKQQRRIEVVAPTFLSLAELVTGTHRIATMHRRLAELMVRTMPLVMREIPFEFPSIRQTAQWHISNSNDGALRWMVERLQAVAAGRPEESKVLRLASARPSASLEHEYRAQHLMR